MKRNIVIILLSALLVTSCLASASAPTITTYHSIRKVNEPVSNIPSNYKTFLINREAATKGTEPAIYIVLNENNDVVGFDVPNVK